MLERSKAVLFAYIIGVMLVISLWSAPDSTLLPNNVVAETVTGLRFVTDGSVPLANKEVRLLCYATDAAGAPLADLMVTTNANGEPMESLPTYCNYVAALHLLHEQPSGKPDHGPAYWVYATSWPPGNSILLETSGDILISEEWPLTLFNVVASLAWEPEPGSTYIAELQQGLRDTSSYLQDLTEGQMALGPVTIHTNGRHWDSADLRWLPTNDFRPTAYVGGIVSETTPYSTKGVLGAAVYKPGAIYLGRYWDGADAFDPIAGSWSTTAGTRTIVHEWGHYALFLYDEYQNPDGQSVYCTCDTLPNGTCTPVDRQASAMSYHYTANELWHPTVHLIPDPTHSCYQTAQWLVHGQTDWQTLAAWHDIQNLPDGLTPILMPTDLVLDSMSLADDLFGRVPGHHTFLPLVKGDGPVSLSMNGSLSLRFNGSALLTETLPTQVYVLERGLSGSPQRILHQGTAVGQPDSSGLVGDITLLGINQDEDSIWFEVDQYTANGVSGGRFAYPDPAVFDPPPIFPPDGSTELTATNGWEASLDATYALSGSRLTTMTLLLNTTFVPNSGFYARLCLPDTAVGCPPDWHRPLQPTANNDIWTATFNPLQGMTELPPYSLVQVYAKDTGALMRWIQVSGVGPAHGDGEGSPLRDGRVMVDTSDPIPEPNECNWVIIMPAANHDALISPLKGNPPNAEEIQGLVNMPLDVDILLPDGGGNCSNLDDEHPSSVTLTFFYSQEVIDRLGINEETELRILNYSIPPTGALPSWEVIPAAGISPELNWIATVPVEQDGIYAIGWVKQP